MGRRRRTGLVVVIVAIGLTLAIVRIVRRDLLRSTKASPSASLAARASRNPEASRPDGGDSSTSDLEAERVPELPLPPPREGMVRYHARLLRSDGKPHTYFVAEATPTDSSEKQTLTLGKQGDVTVDAPAECSAIDFTSRGFVPVHHRITQRELEQEELGAIVFEQAARLEVEIVHAPRRETEWLHVTAWVALPVPNGFGHSIGFGGFGLATVDASAHATFFVPSQTPVCLGLRGEGVSLRREIASLPAGTSSYVIDFAQLRSLHGRVVGVPPECARGAPIWLQRYVPEQNGLFPGMDASSTLDAAGRFVFAALPDGPFALQLEQAPLRAADGAHRDWWTTDALPPERELEVEPTEPLLGVEVSPLDSGLGKRPNCSVHFDGPSPNYASMRSDDDGSIARGLVREAAFRGATHAFLEITDQRSTFDLRQIVLAADRLPPLKNRIVAIPLDQLALPTASLVVSLPIFASRDWGLVLVKAGQRPWSTSEPIGVKRERGLFSFTFKELAAGRYDLFATLHDSFFVHRVAAGIELGEGERKEFDVEPPSLESIDGRITNWSDIPEPLRPKEIHLERSSPIVAGRFRISAVRPVEMQARFTDRLAMNIPVTADVTTLADGTLAVTYPANELDLFEVTTTPPGEAFVAASIEPPSVPETIDLTTWCPRVGADPHGSIEILRRRSERVRGWVTEWSHVRDARTLGWFTSDAPSGTIVADGHFVEVENGADGTTATLFLVARPIGDWQPPRLAICRVITGLARSFWLPAAADSVDVEFPGHPRDRVPAASIGAQWTIAPK